MLSNINGLTQTHSPRLTSADRAGMPNLGRIVLAPLSQSVLAPGLRDKVFLGKISFPLKFNTKGGGHQFSVLN